MVSLPPDFESGASAYSTTPAELRLILYNTFFQKASFIFTYIDEKQNLFLCILQMVGQEIPFHILCVVEAPLLMLK